MTITTIPKSKFVRKKDNFEVQFYIGRQVKITKDVFVKTLLSLGTFGYQRIIRESMT